MRRKLRMVMALPVLLLIGIARGALEELVEWQQAWRKT